MTAAVYRSGTASLAVPQTQNTAPVYEFNCMYTHDIRRKQKRWQDGFLRFHTFNNRVMVYDIPRNFIGDTHWKEGTELQDGDEVQLEGGCVIVQVAERIGRTETDLTELRRSVKKGSSEAGSSSPARAAHIQAPLASSGNVLQPATQLRHRSLNTLLGPSRGPIGKATLPTQSPFEQRNARGENAVPGAERPSKRMRVDQSSSWNITRTTTTTKPMKQKEPPLWARTSDSAKRHKTPSLETGQQRLGTKDVIDLSVHADEQEQFLEGFSSDALAPPSSPHQEQHLATKAAPIRSSSPAFQRQRTPEVSPLRVPPEGPRAMDPVIIPKALVKAKASDFNVYMDCRPPTLENRADEIQQITDNLQPRQRASRADELSNPVKCMQPPSTKTNKTLRMTASAPKKKTLLCQEQVTKKPSRVHSANTENAIDLLLGATSEDAAFPGEEAKSQRRQLEERLAKIGRKRRAMRSDADDDLAHGLESPIESTTSGVTGVRQQPPPPDVALEPAQLDQMIMPQDSRKSPEITLASSATERQLRRVASESSNVLSSRTKRAAGAPVRYTPSPAKKRPTREKALEHGPAERVPILLPKPKAKDVKQRSFSLDTTSNGTSTVILNRPFQPPRGQTIQAAAPEKAADAWSREAFDLFTWRPPGWDEEKWCFRATDAVTNGTA